MSGQLSLLDAGESIARERLFLALMPDAASAAALAGLGKRLLAAAGLSARVLPAERLHVTLHHLGDFPCLPASTLAAARQAAATVSMPEFALAFARAGSFSGARQAPFVLRAEGADATGMIALQAALATALARVGLRGDGRFTPHLTLAYARRALPWQALPVAAGWMAGDFVLIRSHLGQGRYDIEGRWPLRGA